MSLMTVDRHGAVAVLTLNRPDNMNALGAPGDGDQVQAVCDGINADPEVRCVILTGAGRAFSAGGDVKAMKARAGAFGGGGFEIRNNYRNNIHRIVRSIYGLEVPTIAAVNGAAVGLGCDVACMCDMRIASDKARFAVTFLKLGLIPGDGGAWLLQKPEAIRLDAVLRAVEGCAHLGKATLGVKGCPVGELIPERVHAAIKAADAAACERLAMITVADLLKAPC